MAKRAGVGIGTVSRVLNNSEQVSPATQARVLAAMQELDFKPSPIARQLPRKQKTRSIGVITHSFFNYDSFMARLRGVQRGLNEADAAYELVLYNATSLRSYDERLQAISAGGPVEGLVIIDLRLDDEHRTALDRAGIPYVGLNEHLDNTWPTIGCDNKVGGYLATRHLIELGHQRIAYVGDEFLDTYGFFTSSQRFAGFSRAMEEAKLPIVDAYTRLGPFGDDVARALTAELLTMETPPTAIFAMSDTQALGCMAAAREAGLRVPDDLSIIGYDNLDIAYYTNLTTIDQHLERGGRSGIRYLLARIDNAPHIVKPALPPLKVVVRGTTAPPPPKA